MKKILIIEDDKGVAQLLEEELTEEGYEVRRAANGRDALAVCKAFVPDLITLDLKMPVMDGLEFLEMYRVEHPHTPIVICTAYPEFKQDFKVWASDAYVVKSGDMSQLKAIIRDLLARSTAPS
ncbi:MAG: response regulator [Nitrospinota bacterium]